MTLAGMCSAGTDEGEVHGSKAVIAETIGFSSHQEFPGSGGFQVTEGSPKAMKRCLSLVGRSSQFFWKGLSKRTTSQPYESQDFMCFLLHVTAHSL